MPEPSGSGMVIIDIGGDIGAASILVADTLEGHELEIRRVGDEWAGVHVAVRERPVGSRTVWAALFPELMAGDYEVRVKSHPDSAVGRFEVVGGSVTTCQYDADAVVAA